jgi:DNA-binding Lrp family transcriptional regulator
MSRELLDAVEEILKNDADVVVPAKKIWRMLQFDEEFQKISVLPFGEFISLLREDGRFEFLPPVQYGEMFDGLTEEEKAEREREMEDLGFFSGERIKLREAKLTGEVLAGMIEKSVDKMMRALQGAWGSKPEDPEAEKRLLEIMKRAKKLQGDIQKIVERIRNGDIPQDPDKFVGEEK